MLTIQPDQITTGTIVRRYRLRIILTYSVTLIENFIELLYPLMIGIAIDGLLAGDTLSVLPLIVTWLIHSLVGVGRQLYDTRLFGRMYRDLASAVITRQGIKGTAISHLAARSALMREFVDFMEEDIPFIITVIVNFIGAFVLLVIFDWIVALYALLILMPLTLINAYHRRVTARINRGLNDQLEQEVEVIESGRAETIQQHFGQLTRWYIRLSDADARTWFTMQPFLVGLVVIALVRSVGMGMEAGDIFVTVTYAFSFVESFDELPMIVQQYSRLQDISQRVNSDSTSDDLIKSEG